MRAWSLALMLGLPVCAAAGAAVPPLTAWPSATAEGEWLAHRGDLAQTGRALRPGRIREPVIAWRCPLGAWRAWVEVAAETGAAPGAWPAAAALAADYLARERDPWDPDARRLDLAGDGQLRTVTSGYNVRYGHFLPAAKGWQKFVMQDGMGIKNQPAGPRRPVARGQLYRYDRGREELVWETGPEEQCEIPLVAVTDVDGDGHPELAVSTWYRVMVFDSRTGAKQAECKWHNGRNYGHFQMADLNGDGRPEAVVLADFMVHLDVLANLAGALQLQWRQEVDYRLFGKRKVLRTLPEAVVRVPGRPAVLVLNLYNQTGDGRWHVVLLDGMSGRAVADWPERFCSGQAAGAALLLSRTAGAGLPPAGELSVARAVADRWQEQAVPVEGRWLRHEARLPDDRATVAAEGRQTAVLTTGTTGETAWLVTRSADREALVGVRLAAAGPEPAARLELPAGLVLAEARRSADGRRLLVAVDGAAWPATKLAGQQLRAEVRSVSAVRPVPDEPVVARLAPNQPPLVLAAGGAGEVAAVQPPGRGQTEPSVLWRRPGRTRGANYEAERLGPVVADLPGGRVLLAATEAADGRAALVGYDATGRQTWRHVFPPRFAGGLPTWNSGGLTDWQIVPRPDGRADVFASLRRSVMHTDESVRLDGGDARERWWCDNLEERGCGGKPLAAARLPDGEAALVSQYPDLHAVLNAAGGQVLAAKPFPHQQLGGWSAYSHPLLLDPDGGGLGVVTSHCQYFVGLWTPAGEVRWHSDYLDGSTRHVGVRRSDGRWQLGVPAYRGGFRCHDAATGEVRWRWDRRPSTDVVTADIDGDGQEEFIFGLGDRLVALGSTGALPQVRWELPLPATCGSPVPADLDGDGQIELVMLCGDGSLVAVAGR